MRFFYGFFLSMGKLLLHRVRNKIHPIQITDVIRLKVKSWLNLHD